MLWVKPWQGSVAFGIGWLGGGERNEWETLAPTGGWSLSGMPVAQKQAGRVHLAGRAEMSGLEVYMWECLPGEAARAEYVCWVSRGPGP